MDSSNSEESFVVDLDASPSQVFRKRRLYGKTPSDLLSPASSPEKTDYAKKKRLLFSMMDESFDAKPSKAINAKKFLISAEDLAEAGPSAGHSSKPVTQDSADEIEAIKTFLTSDTPETVPVAEEQHSEKELLEMLLSSDEDNSDDHDSQHSNDSENEDFTIEEDIEGNAKWFSENPGQTRKPFDWSGIGIQLDDWDGESPWDYFNLLLTPDFVNMIVEKTNKNAQKILNAVSAPHSRILKWKNTTSQEFMVFLGILFHMGTVKMPSFSHYWSTHFLFQSNIFSQHMSKNRFLLLMRVLHCEDERKEGKLKKISPMIDYFNNRMAEVYRPGENICIDESLVLWRGRLSFRQYMKGKGAQYGIKLYIVAESLGPVLKMIVYSGAGDTEIGGRDHVKKVVRKLVEDYKHKGHRLFMDNYYNSVGLAEELLDSDIYCTGTLKKKRKGNPKKVVEKKLKKGESFTLYSQKEILVTKFNDRRDVLLLSADVGGEMVTSTTKSGREKQIPKVVDEYNKKMGGVDFSDQLLSYYHVERKTIRWYKKIAIRIFEQILLNAYLLCNARQTSKMSLLGFKMKIVEKLLPKPPPIQPSPRPVIHLPSNVERKGSAMRRRCKLCWDKYKIRKQTQYFCPLCPKKPGLCLTCFREFHNY